MKWTLILVIFFFACTRDGDTDPEQPEISFDINGIHYSHIGYQSAASNGVGIFALKATAGGDASYNFAGLLNQGNFIQVTISTHADTLKIRNYTNPDVFIAIKAGNDTYYFFGATSATITSYQNGAVSGTFGGSASKLISLNPDVLQPATFSNGIIKNVRINY